MEKIPSSLVCGGSLLGSHTPLSSVPVGRSFRDPTLYDRVFCFGKIPQVSLDGGCQDAGVAGWL